MRNRAAAVDRAQQPVPQLQPDQNHGQPAGLYQHPHAQPLRVLETTRLERRPDHHPDRTCPEHWRAHPGRREDRKMSELSVSTSVPDVAIPAMMAKGDARPKVSVRDLNFYYGEHHA